MKESENLKPTESSSPEIKPEEEKKIIASLKSESFSFVPDQLDAIMAKCHLQEKVDPVLEKEVTSHLKEEAASFVPDKLQDIMKACGLDSTVSSEDEEALVSALEGDSLSFVPNQLGAVKKATGTYNPYLDQAALATQEKLHNEGAEVVPNVEDKVFQQTGVKKHFSFRNYFKKHWIPLTSGFAVAAAAVAVIVIVPNAVKQTSASGTYVAVTITPASSLLTTASPSYLYSGSTSTSYSINKYTPSWSYFADADNLVNTATFTPRNYSAKLLDANLSLSGNLSASKTAASLVTPSYQYGYLQNVQANNMPIYNNITIDVYSTDASYASKYESDYKTALASQLENNKIYANVAFNVTSISDELLGVSTDKAQTLLDVCTAVNSVLDADHQISLSSLKKKDDAIINQMNEVLTSASSAQLTPRALTAIKEGLGLVVSGVETDLSEQEYQQEKTMLISSYAQALPWCNGNLNIEKIKYGLQNEGYYLVGDSIKGTDDGMAWKMFKELRNYIIAKEATSTDSLVTLLKKTTSLIQDNAMPDGYNQERPDNGGHDHGDPGPGDWHGGIGNFGPDGGRGH